LDIEFNRNGVHATVDSNDNFKFYNQAIYIKTNKVDFFRFNIQRNETDFEKFNEFLSKKEMKLDEYIEEMRKFKDTMNDIKNITNSVNELVQSLKRYDNFDKIKYSHNGSDTLLILLYLDWDVQSQII
jgi:hypothetical protein